MSQRCVQPHGGLRHCIDSRLHQQPAQFSIQNKFRSMRPRQLIISTSTRSVLPPSLFRQRLCEAASHTAATITGSLMRLPLRGCAVCRENARFQGFPDYYYIVATGSLVKGESAVSDLEAIAPNKPFPLQVQACLQLTLPLRPVWQPPVRGAYCPPAVAECTVDGMRSG